MIPFDVADMLEEYARRVLELPGVSPKNPHLFTEAKSELRGDMLARARELRTVPRVTHGGRVVGAIATGDRQGAFTGNGIERRVVTVETRRRRA